MLVPNASAIKMLQDLVIMKRHGAASITSSKLEQMTVMSATVCVTAWIHSKSDFVQYFNLARAPRWQGLPGSSASKTGNRLLLETSPCLRLSPRRLLARLASFTQAIASVSDYFLPDDPSVFLLSVSSFAKSFSKPSFIALNLVAKEASVAFSFGTPLRCPAAALMFFS